MKSYRVRNFYLLLLVFFAAGCTQDITPQQKEEIKRQAQAVVWEAEKFRDSISVLTWDIELRTEYDLFYRNTIESMAESTAAYKDSLYMELNRHRPDYMLLMEITNSWELRKKMINEMLRESKAEADQFFQ